MSGTTITITGDNNSSNLIFESASGSINSTDVPSTAVPSILSISNEYGDENIVHCMEEFHCLNEVGAKMVCEAFQPKLPSYGVLRFTLWQGATPDTSNVAFCIRTFLNERATSYSCLKFVNMVTDTSDLDPLLNLMTNVNYIFVSKPSDVPNLKAALSTTPAALKSKNPALTTDEFFYAGVSGYTKIDTTALLTSTGPNSNVIVSEKFMCSTPTGATALAKGISASALSSYDTLSSPLEWQIGVEGSEVWCFRNFSGLTDYIASLSGVTAEFFTNYSDISNIDVLLHLPDVNAGKTEVENSSYEETVAAAGKGLNIMYYHDTITVPPSGQQPIFKN